ncbi:hypothetical protein FF011L_44650 [Roseimaritima multifibrata]|uniref:Uncharacterized protein n=1 Tax=Roseimaritima multifibrata TaxID=1930274 RepID=A0A517ML92_9BACT|nr:hypothetical protein FF011L_44650 [Roseimaritima multifibrata]
MARATGGPEGQIYSVRRQFRYVNRIARHCLIDQECGAPIIAKSDGSVANAIFLRLLNVLWQCICSHKTEVGRFDCSVDARSPILVLAESIEVVCSSAGQQSVLR